jgi:hypothetical protein
MAGGGGFEPPANTFKGCCSANCANPHSFYYANGGENRTRTCKGFETPRHFQCRLLPIKVSLLWRRVRDSNSHVVLATVSFEATPLPIGDNSPCYEMEQRFLCEAFTASCRVAKVANTLYRDNNRSHRPCGKTRPIVAAGSKLWKSSLYDTSANIIGSCFCCNII